MGRRQDAAGFISGFQRIVAEAYLDPEHAHACWRRWSRRMGIIGKKTGFSQEPRVSEPGPEGFLRGS